MIYPSKEKYLEYSKDYNLIPVCSEVIADFETPLSIFLKLKGRFLLESVEQGSNVGRYSIIGVGIKTEFRFCGKQLEIKKFEEGKPVFSEKREMENPLIAVREFMQGIKVAEFAELPPFYGGFIGYLGYESIQYFEKIPVLDSKDEIPDGILIIPEVVFVFDVVKRAVYSIFTTGPGSEPDKIYNETVERLKAITEKITSPLISNPEISKKTELEIKYCMTKENFINSVNKCKQYITDGEIIQVVFSQRFEVKTETDPFLLYRTLRVVNPSPYMFYLDFDDFKIIGSSPEVMVRVHNKEILLKPIAGTRKRGDTLDSDKRIAAELLNDPKEKAEHVMLVDLGRNDLGRIATPGSVEVIDYMSIEKYSHVMHIVTTIKASLDENYDVFDVIKASFPAGTLTGAPKIRAMEIIYELEDLRRGPYGGMILNLGYNMNLDSCITIRTLVLKDNIAKIQAGAGIVADSDPESEYQETINKAEAMIKTIKQAGKEN